MIVDMWIKRGYLFYALRIHLSKVFIHSLFDIFNLILNEKDGKGECVHKNGANSSVDFERINEVLRCGNPLFM